MTFTHPPEGERTFQDMKRWNSLIGKTYYMSWNGFANKIVPQISNYHVAEPTPEMEPFHPKVMSAVMTAQPHMNSFY